MAPSCLLHIFKQLIAIFGLATVSNCSVSGCRSFRINVRRRNYINPYKFVIYSGLLLAIFFASAQLKHGSSAHINFNFHFDSNDEINVGAKQVKSEICAPPGRYVASGGNPIPTFRDSVSVTFFKSPRFLDS